MHDTDHPERAAIFDCLASSRELTAFCTQNGWIDNDTLRYDVLARSSDRLELAVYFDEVIMEGAGCVAGRVPCYGRVRLRLDEQGAVIEHADA